MSNIHEVVKHKNYQILSENPLTVLIRVDEAWDITPRTYPTDRKNWLLRVPVTQWYTEFPAKINARVPNPNTGPTKSMRTTLNNNAGYEPNFFYTLNQGISLLCSRIEVIDEFRTEDQCHYSVILEFNNLDETGMPNGKHTNTALETEMSQIITKINNGEDIDQHVKVLVEVGHSKRTIAQIAKAWNFNIQVSAESIINLEGKFDWLKQILIRNNWGSLVSYVQNGQLYDINGKQLPEKVPYHINDIMKRLALFNLHFYPVDGEDAGRKQPNEVYNNAGNILKNFDGNDEIFESYERMAPRVKDILLLSEMVERDICYGSTKRGTVFVKKSNSWINHKENTFERTFPFMNETFQNEGGIYEVGWGILAPIIASFRVFLNEDYTWKCGSLENLRRILQNSFPSVVNAVNASWRSLKDSSNMGRSEAYWRSTYAEAEKIRDRNLS